MSDKHPTCLHHLQWIIPWRSQFLTCVLFPIRNQPKSQTGSCHIFRLRCGSYQVVVQRSYWGWCSFSRKIHCIKIHYLVDIWHIGILMIYDDICIKGSELYLSKQPGPNKRAFLLSDSWNAMGPLVWTFLRSLCCTPEAWNFGWAARQEFDLNGQGWLAGRLTMCKFPSFYSYLYLI